MFTYMHAYVKIVPYMHDYLHACRLAYMLACLHACKLICRNVYVYNSSRSPHRIIGSSLAGSWGGTPGRGLSFGFQYLGELVVIWTRMRPSDEKTRGKQSRVIVLLVWVAPKAITDEEREKSLSLKIHPDYHLSPWTVNFLAF